jgi:molecular chaperone GrpE
VTRPTPKEKVVREQLSELDGHGPGGAAEESAAPEVEATGAEATEADAPAVAAERAESGEEQPEPAGAEQPPAAEPPAPEPDPLAKAEAERDEYLDLARRTQADFENYRKRTAKDVAAAGDRAKIGLVRDMLPVVDNLERALASADHPDDSLAEGVRLVLSELQGVLAREGVVALEPAGEAFDPTVHEALSTREQDGAEQGVVLDVVEKGYQMNDTVIRPARVVVSA